MTTQAQAPENLRRHLYDMMRSYRHTAVLRCALRLGVFDALTTSPLQSQQVASIIDCDPRGVRLLINALVALRLVEGDTENESYWLTQCAVDLLSSQSPTFYGGMVEITASDYEWDSFAQLDRAVRNGGTVEDMNAEVPGFPYWETFARHMAPVAQPTADLVSRTVAKDWLVKHPRILDVACGHALYGLTCLKDLEGQSLTLLDWPNVLPHAVDRARSLGLGDRVTTLEGDMFTTPLEGPYDLILVTNVLHHFNQEQAVRLLRRARSAVTHNGRLAVVGFALTDTAPVKDPEPHLFSLLMLSWTEGGEVHHARELDSILLAAGWEPHTHVPVDGLPFHVLTAAPAAQKDQT